MDSSTYTTDGRPGRCIRCSESAVRVREMGAGAALFRTCSGRDDNAARGQTRRKRVSMMKMAGSQTPRVCGKTEAILCD